MNPSSTRLSGRYERIAVQLSELFEENPDAQSRMATAVALLHHKMSHFFWTGFYRLVGEDLIVGPYQGPLACSILLPRGAGVCWAGITRGESILVSDVRQFEGHIACDSRSRSEVVVPYRDRSGKVVWERSVVDIPLSRVVKRWRSMLVASKKAPRVISAERSAVSRSGTKIDEINLIVNRPLAATPCMRLFGVRSTVLCQGLLMM